jgi:hypothetical protein
MKGNPMILSKSDILITYPVSNRLKVTTRRQYVYTNLVVSCIPHTLKFLSSPAMILTALRLKLRRLVTYRQVCTHAHTHTHAHSHTITPKHRHTDNRKE